MNKKLLLTTLVALLIGARFYHYTPFYKRITKAVAFIHPTQDHSVSGIVTFTEHTKGIKISAEVSGLTPGAHGFHVHEFGDCSYADGRGAGDHFNPAGHPHGGPESKVRHAGDLGNLVADRNGNATYTHIDGCLTLNGPDSVIGRSVVVHEHEDDLATQPTGDSGGRVGCGTIGIGG